MNDYQVQWKTHRNEAWKQPAKVSREGARGNVDSWSPKHLRGTVNYLRVLYKDEVLWEGERQGDTFDLTSLTFDPPLPKPSIKPRSVLEI